MNQPYPPAPTPQAQPSVPRNGLGTTGFVLGLLGLIFSFIPLVGIVAWPLVILGLIFGLVGFNRVRKGQATNKGLSIAGIVLSAIGLVICIVWAAAFGKAANDLNNNPPPTGAPAGNSAPAQPAVGGASAQQSPAPAQQQSEAPATHTVEYKVSGSGKANNITYTTDGMTTSNQESNVKLPWTKTITLPADQAVSVVTVVAQGGSSSAKVDVTITVDGKVVKEAHATGYGVATASANIGTLGG